MNERPQPRPSDQNGSGTGISLDDAYFTLFRRKWLLLGFTCLGLLSASVICLVKPPRYESKAKLMVRYVAGAQVKPESHDTITQTDSGADSIIKSEVEIMTSLDVAAEVADLVGPERILAKKGGGNDRMAAAGVIRSGIEVDPPRTAVITITFRHPDKELVEPVLRTLIDRYIIKHREVRMGGGEKEAYFSKLRDNLRVKLADTEEKLKQLNTQAKGMSVADAKKTFQGQIEKLMTDLLTTQTDLAEARAVLGEVPSTSAAEPKSALSAVPADKIENYNAMILELEVLKKRERDLLFQSSYTLQHPQVTNVQGQITRLVLQKRGMEKEFPALASLRPVSFSNGTNFTGVDMPAEMARITRYTARVESLGTQLSNLQAQATSVIELEPMISQLQREREQDEKDYQYYLETLNEARMGDGAGAGKVTNMSVVQHPTPPGLDNKKLLKLIAIAFGGCVACGLALAFFLDLVLDRTIKRSVEVERHLRVPLLVSIPDTRWSGRLRLPGRKHHRSGRRNGSAHRSDHSPAPTNGLIRWDSRHNIQLYANGLRERLITYFEVNGQNHHKPRRVAVTSCSPGAGVTTIANSLAAALSKIPDVKVMLVDMNIGQGVARTFRNGEPCASNGNGQPSPSAESSPATNSSLAENLAVVPMRSAENGNSANGLPSALTHLAPQFEANDHDFIIFDLPPATQTSMTPRLAGYMDIVLLVLESEKTGRQLAGRANVLMRESRANVAAVLNKYRRYVPERLSQEF